MATVVNFHGKNCIEPGSYAATVYSPTSVVNVAEFGNCMIIDTGICKNTYNGKTYEFAGGSGIKGQLAKGLKSVYEFTSIEDFLAFMGGGLVADIAQKIFTPRDGVAGAPKLYYARAATTTPAILTLTLSEGNALVLTCKNEGLVGNGMTTLDETPASYTSNGTNVVKIGDIIQRDNEYVTVVEGDAEIGQSLETFTYHEAIHAADGTLKAGYSARIVAGETPNTFKLQVLRGTFSGVDEAGEPFGSYKYDECVPNVIAESDDLTTLKELYDWCSNSKVMLAHFVVTMTGADATPLAAMSQVLAAGGTSTYLNDGEYAAVVMQEPIPLPTDACTRS